MIEPEEAIASPQFAGSLSNPDHHLRALTGLRAFAAAWVVLFHGSAIFATWAPISAKLLPITGVGFLGVDLFFALSGFILCHRYLDKLGSQFSLVETREFLCLRIARIYPVLVFTLAVFVVYVGILAILGTNTGWDPKLPVSDIPENLLLIHAWFNQPASWNVPSWSVSMEWLAYLTFPIMALVLFRIACSKHVVIWSMLFVTVVNVPLFLHIVGFWEFPTITLYTSPAYGGIVGLSVIRLIAGFGGGCVAFVLARTWQRSQPEGSSPHRSLTLCVILFTLLAIIMFARSGATEQTTFTWVLSPALVLLVATVGLGGPNVAILERPFFVKLGIASYSVYMVHWLVYSMVGVLPGVSIGRSLAARIDIGQQAVIVRSFYCLFSVLLCWIVGLFVWRIVEEPARRKLRSFMVSSVRNVPVEERDLR